jgi:hypothetical protein
MKFCFFLLPLLVAVAGCSSESKPMTDVIIMQDFDSLNGWNGLTADVEASSLSTAQAHSGKYAAKVGGSVEYGQGYVVPLGQLIRKKPKALEITYWCYRADTKGYAATLVCSIERPSTSKQLLWKGADLTKEASKERSWTKVTQRVDIPAEIDFSDVIRFYPWRGVSIGDTYFDDLQVRALSE